MSTHVKELEPRVAILETSVEQLTNNVEKLVEHSEKVERSISELTVLLTKASAPRKTDWQTIISFVFLLGTVVSAIYWPLNMRMDFIEQRQGDMQAKLQRETALITERTDKEVQNLGDRLILRLNTADADHNSERQKDLDELRQWRLKAMEGKM
jgi:preprotein translocase subunit SecF